MGKVRKLGNKPRLVIVQKIIKETPTVKTILFKDSICSNAEPGQFVMVWIPGSDEIPMSISFIDKSLCGITVKNVGKSTEALHRLKYHSEFGLRGPYGKGFRIFKGTSLIVAGGVGMAPLNPLLVKLEKLEIKPTVLLGATTASELLFCKQLRTKLRQRLILATDDGSAGFKGLASDLTLDFLKENSLKNIYACGPELLLKKIFEYTSKFNMQVQMSLERHMKCGLGICGNCMIDGLRICKEGPVISSESLKSIDDFGFARLDASGRKTPINK